MEGKPITHSVVNFGLTPIALRRVLERSRIDLDQREDGQFHAYAHHFLRELRCSVSTNLIRLCSPLNDYQPTPLLAADG